MGVISEGFDSFKTFKSFKPPPLFLPRVAGMKEGVERLERLERFEQFFSLYYSGSASVGSTPPRTQSWPFSTLYLYWYSPRGGGPEAWEPS